MKTPCAFITLAAALCAAAFTPAAMADSCTYAGDVTEARLWPGDKDVIRFGMAYVESCTMLRFSEYQLTKSADAAHVQRWTSRRDDARAGQAELRRLWKAAILAHPEQVNDLWSSGHDGPFTPLHLAAQAEDTEMMELLLKMGAIPFLCDTDGKDAYLPHMLASPWPHPHGWSRIPDPKVLGIITQARAGYNLLEICLRAQQAGHTLNEWYPERPHLDAAAHRPATDGERAYLYADEKLNSSWERALNDAHRHFRNEIVAARVIEQREEGEPGLAKATVVVCRVDSVIEGNCRPGSVVEYRIYPEEPVDMMGRRLIISAEKIEGGKVVEADPCVFGYESHHKAFRKVERDRRKQPQQAPPPQPAQQPQPPQPAGE